MATSDNPFAGLTADQILQLIQSGKSGMTATPITAGIGGGQDGYYGPTTTQYNLSDGQAYHPGQMNYDYDSSGNYLGSHASEEDKNWQHFLMAAAAMVGGVAMLGGAGSAGAAGTLGEGWAGGAAGAGGGLGTAAGTAGTVGSLGDMTAAGYDPMFGAAADGVPNTAAMGAGGAGGGSAVFNPAVDSQLASSQLGLTAGDTAAGGIPSVTVNAAAGTPGALTGGGSGSWLSNLLPSGASSLLGPAATLLGAAVGSQPQKTTSQRDIPDWLKPYVTGQGGLLDSTNSLMHQQMGYVPQQAQQISNVGMGLLQQPVAGNGFQQFQQRPRFGG